MVTFHPNPIQLQHRLDSEGWPYGFIVKPRQLGFTTDYSIDLLDDALWTPGISCAIIADCRENLVKIFNIVKRAYENLPLELKPKTKTDTKNMYQFTHRFDGIPLDSEIYVALKLRSATVQRLHITESAYIKNRDELKMGTKQAVPLGGRITEETTGNGMENFYDDYMAAYEKKKKGLLTKMDYNTYFYAWFQNPEYALPGTMPEISADDLIRYGDEKKEREKYHLTDGQLLWRRWKIDEMRSGAESLVGLNVLQRFKQEYPATLLECFQSGAGNVFDVEILDQIQPVTPFDPLTANRELTANWENLDPRYQQKVVNMLSTFKTFHSLGVKVWEFPKEGKSYIIGVDPSDGEGSDNTDIDVWDAETLDQVAQFYGKIRPDHGAEICAELAEFYNKAFVGVENNMLTFILALSKIYDNYYTEVEIDKRTQRRSVRLGWKTSTKTRDPMIDDFIVLFEDGKLGIKSAVTLKEMKTFVKKEDGKREHANGKHDDALFGGFIAMQMRKFLPKKGRLFYKQRM